MTATLYLFGGLALFVLGVHGFLLRTHLIRRIVALNLMGSGVFLVFGASAARGGEGTDPVAHALIITGIVVAVAATALALALLVRLFEATGSVTLDPDESQPADRNS